MPRHGAEDNRPNRFERIAYAPDPDADPADAPSPAVQLYADPTRQILARNDSPDVGFDVSVNPYRGCTHGCVYCLAPDTPVLHTDMTWRPIGGVKVGDVLVGFDEQVAPGRQRKLRTARVEAVWASRRPTLRLVTKNADVIATAEHRWLQGRSFRWSRTEQLSPGRFLRHMPVCPAEVADSDYRAGYVVGLTLGDGTFRYRPGQRSDKLGFPQAYWRIAMVDKEPLQRSVEYLGQLGIDVQIRPFDPGPATATPMWKVETRALGKLGLLHRLLTAEVDSRSWRRGYLAGFFDAEGHNGTSLRISQVNVDVLRRLQRHARSLGFDFKLEPRPGVASTIRLVGSVTDRIRFFGTVRPSIHRKLEATFGRMPDLAPEPVLAIEPGPVRDVIDIQTSTGTFYAAGLPTHNCYARPTHEYLGFSAGLDFETRIMVKRDAATLLRKELSAPGWRPQTIALSGVTDPYQPAERELRLTRGCLEVLAELRNPAVIVTKNRLVSRDADLLAELARHGAVSVLLSVTTLDPALHRVMEPGSSAPRLRLEAIRALAEAGVPAGVLVAPIIPGLNDHETPAILAAAADAGARFAGHVVLRLPHGVKQIFETWLERHFPDRRQKVMNRILSLRGGRLNDPRFGSRMRGEGPWADQIHALFELGVRRAGLGSGWPRLSAAAFRRPGPAQASLF